MAEHRTEEAIEEWPLYERRWRCEVLSSGYHNGATCSPNDPHSAWNCEYRWVARSLPDTQEAALLVQRIEWLRKLVAEFASQEANNG